MLLISILLVSFLMVIYGHRIQWPAFPVHDLHLLPAAALRLNVLNVRTDGERGLLPTRGAICLPQRPL